jgi:hypothetical protein
MSVQTNPYLVDLSDSHDTGMFSAIVGAGKAAGATANHANQTREKRVGWISNGVWGGANAAAHASAAGLAAPVKKLRKMRKNAKKKKKEETNDEEKKKSENEGDAHDTRSSK